MTDEPVRPRPVRDVLGRHRGLVVLVAIVVFFGGGWALDKATRDTGAERRRATNELRCDLQFEAGSALHTLCMVAADK